MKSQEVKGQTKGHEEADDEDLEFDEEDTY